VVALVAVVALGFAAPALAATGGAGEPGGVGEAPLEEAPSIRNSPFDRQGMWIWYVSHSEGGSLPAIVKRAKQAGIGTVYVKSGDGGTVWNQFNRALVSRLHHAGIDVCAWQFVYGEHPAAEATVGAISVRRGADCLAIDAESDYEGRYAAADRYIRSLRAQIGATFPLSLAGFPYVDYHPSYPYSVFLGPGGAQFNQPQMYWKTIGVSIATIFEHTYLYNRIWGHPIYPIGQTYEGPGNGPLRQFRRYSASYGAGPPSWWDWQETDSKEWAALGARAAAQPLTGFRPDPEQPLLKRGDKGDMVVWAQEHLITAGNPELPVNGIFGKLTRAAVVAFQEDQGLEVDGQIGTETWEALLRYRPFRVRWAAVATGGSARISAAGPVGNARRPLSASLPAKGYEIPPHGGSSR
jgi:Putative peptidoglycan binding domain